MADINGRTPIRITHLEMKARPEGLPECPRPPEDFRLEKMENLSVAWYRRIYHAVGDDFPWTDRSRLSDLELGAIVQDPQVEIFVIRSGDEDAGYAELDCRNPDDIELAYLGIVPRFHGRGLGRFLLNWAVDYAWRCKKPSRLWIHTETRDHTAALPMYKRTGFRVFKVVDTFAPPPLPRDSRAPSG